MDMNISQLDAQQSTVYGTIMNRKAANGDAAQGGQRGMDTVTISDHGKQLSQSIKTSSSGEAVASATAQVTSGVSGASVEVNVNDLQQELREKNTEVSSTEAEVEALKRQVKTDPGKKSELSSKQNELRDLEDEASSLQAELYA